MPRKCSCNRFPGVSGGPAGLEKPARFGIGVVSRVKLAWVPASASSGAIVLIGAIVARIGPEPTLTRRTPIRSNSPTGEVTDATGMWMGP